MKSLKDCVEDHVSILLWFTSDVEKLVSMVVLHFDISEKRARNMVTTYLKRHHSVLWELEEKKK